MPALPLNFEYMMLCIALLTLFAVIWTHAISGAMQNGFGKMTGNRDALPADNPFRARAKRCVDNHLENLVLCAPLVLMAGQLGGFSQTTALAALLFAAGRVIHAVFYLLGVPALRALGFVASTSGLIMLAIALFQVF